MKQYASDRMLNEAASSLQVGIEDLRKDHYRVLLGIL
jgi:hypothetical protein